MDKNEEQTNWKEVDCDVLEYRKLDLEFYENSGVLTEKDKKYLKNRMLEFINEGVAIEIASHFDSNESSVINMFKSVEAGVTISDYLYSIGVDSSQIVVSGYGDKKPKRKCPEHVNCAAEIYKKNTRIEYRIINTSN